MNETKFFVSYYYSDTYHKGNNGFGHIKITTRCDVPLTYDLVKEMGEVIRESNLKDHRVGRDIIILNIIKLEA